MKELTREIFGYLPQKDLLTCRLVCKEFHKIIQNIDHVFTTRKIIIDNMIEHNLHYKLIIPLKNIKIDISCNKKIVDNDFRLLKGVHTLNMRWCNQETITDKSL